MIKKNTKSLHKRNPHNQDYDFEELCLKYPALKEFLFINKYQNLSIDFSSAKAVLALNKALLFHFYEISFWDLPKEHLCPPIPGRADYIHYLADLLAKTNLSTIPKGKNIKVLDIGVGANCIYPIVGNHAYKWSFVASDISQTSLDIALSIVNNNVSLKNNIDLRHQKKSNDIFKNIIKNNEKFDLTLCNPPFHKSKKDALEGSSRKVKNLSKNKNAKTVLNFSGTSNELWCKGGEEEFIKNMILQSKEFKKNCLYFTTLVSKQQSLDLLYKTLKQIKALEVHTINMKQGQKISRILAWTFLDKNEKEIWVKNRF